MNELVSIHCKVLIEETLSMYALANMARSSEDLEYLKSAREWMPRVESTIAALKYEFERIMETK